MGLIRSYNEFVRSDEAMAGSIAGGTILLAMLAGGIAFQALKSGDVLGAVEAGGTAVALGGVAVYTALVHDRAPQA